MKEFDLEKAKAGAAVCTRDGRDVEILKFDMKNNKPIVAVVTYDEDLQASFNFYLDGKFSKNEEDETDLMMKPTKQNGYVNIYYNKTTKDNELSNKVWMSREDAEGCGKCTDCDDYRYISTAEIEWEE